MLLCMYLFTIFLSTCLDKLGSELTSEGATSLGFICNVCIILSQNLKMMLATCVITMNCHCSQAYFSLLGPPYFFWSRQSPRPCWGSVQCLYYTRTGGWRSVRRPPSHPAWPFSLPLLLGVGGDILGGELICVVNSCCWGKGFVVTRAMVGTGWFSLKSNTRESLYLRKLHITVRTTLPPAMNLNNLDLETFFEVCLVVVHILQHILAFTDSTAS